VKRCVVALAAGMAAGAACADADMRVLTDELTERGDIGIDLQLLAARRARSGEISPNAQRGLVEVSYGIADDWETSVQLPLSRLHGNTTIGGANLEAQYVAPHEREGGYAGIRIEIGYAGAPDEKRSWQTEWRPILGWRGGPWHGVANIGITLPISCDDKRAGLQPTFKVTRAISGRSALGFELAIEAGPLSHPLPHAQQRQILLAVIDTRWHKIDITFGVGKGLNAVSDRLTGKLLASWELDD
jgi:hypothetical protein